MDAGVPELALERKGPDGAPYAAPYVNRHHGGGAFVELGSPAKSNTCSSCAASVLPAASLAEGQEQNLPRESRLWQSQNPWPSYHVKLHMI